MRYKLNEYKSVYVKDIIPVYTYIEGDNKEDYYVDFQNAIYYLLDDTGEPVENWYIIAPYVHKDLYDTPYTEKDFKWFVILSSNPKCIRYEWDFENHCIIK